MPWTSLRRLSLVLWTVGASAALAQAPAPSRPNVVLIVVDDAAWMDFGAYGGEARTPTIDALAQRGAMFTGYHTSPLCSPSRSMLLTGIDNHRTGVATIEEVLPSALAGQPGYSLHFEPGVTTVASHLKQAGYRTYMTGKWHLGHEPGDLPNDHGFDRSFALDASGADNWEDKPYMPYYNEAPWFEDGKPADLPAEFYSSKFIVDKLLEYLDGDTRSEAPFFAYVAFQAVHIPVQAPAELTTGYADRFDEGWEELRQARWRRAQQLGLIPADAALAPMPASMRRWQDLDPEERERSAKAMAVYSAMFESMDQHIGRLVESLRARGQLDSTLFFITSDNGPEPSDPVHAPGMGLWMALNGYGWETETLGERGSLNFIGPEWASAVASPSRLFKFYTAQGGIRVPLIAAGPGVAPAHRVTALTHVTDVAPTILDYAGVTPQAEPDDQPITGKSLRPVLDGSTEAVRGDDETVGIEVSGNAALFKGRYKLVRNGGAHGDDTWRIYDWIADPGETNDLAPQQPERLAAMLADYDDYKRRSGVLDLPEGYDVERQVQINALLRQLRFYGWIPASLLVIVVGLILLRRRARRHAVG